MELVALISSGKGSWGQVAGVINREEWDNIILIGNDFAKKFTADDWFKLTIIGLDADGAETGQVEFKLADGIRAGRFAGPTSGWWLAKHERKKTGSPWLLARVTPCPIRQVFPVGLF